MALTPKRSPRSRRADATAPPIPSSTPTIVTTALSLSTMRITPRDVAPRAMRTPISRVRRETAELTRP